MLVLCEYQALVRFGDKPKMISGNIMVEVRSPDDIYGTFMAEANYQLLRMRLRPDAILMCSYLPECGTPRWELH